ncbi:carboxymuconolactone decarboxylase family protein [Alphaproteobacteria bacterium]|nr:carboxymuconolactone decarboxylase family protein [Alphaproteobacteria bacterium]
MKNEYEKGYEKLKEILGINNAKKTVSAFDAIDKNIGKLLLEFVYGNLYQNETLDIKTRQLCTISALTVMGQYKPHLKTHIDGALNVGVSKAEIVEVILQMIAYAGFPAATTALMIAKNVFDNK